MSFFDDVREFHAKFSLPHHGDGTPPGLLESSVYEFRRKFLREELFEFEESHEKGDLAAAVDALVDLAYVALGTAHLMAAPFDECWDAVHRANMAKERAASADDGRSKRGHALDVVKPLGWTPPDHASILERHGWVAPK